MSLFLLDSLPKPSLRALIQHFSVIDDWRAPWRVAHPLPEVLLLVVCATICDCDGYDQIAAWGEANLPFLRRTLDYHYGVPCGRWLTILMNRISPALFAAAFTDWVRATWPARLDLVDQVAIDGKTSRRSHDRAEGRPPLHLVSAFATTARLVIGQQAVPDKASETTAIPALIERLSTNNGLAGALISIDAVATNAAIAATIRKAGANYLLAVKANQPTLRAEIERLFADAGPNDRLGALDVHRDLDKGHGRIEERTVAVAREVDWLDGTRRFPGETRLPGVACLIKVASRTELADRCRLETRYYVASADLTAAAAAAAVRAHWQIENGLHWVLDVVFADDQSRLRKGHGANNMAVVRHFAFNLLRSAPEPPRPPRSPLKRGPRPGSTPRPTSLRLRRKIASWTNQYASDIIGVAAR